MNVRRKWILLFVGVILTFGLVWVGTQESKPRYKGHTLYECAMIVVRYGRPENTIREAEEGIRQLGTNGMHTVLEWITYRAADHPVAVFRGELSHLPLPERIRTTLLKPFEEEEFLAHYAGAVFRILNTNAASTIPALVQIVKTNRNPEVGRRALSALYSIGPQTIPQLVAIIDDPTMRVRAEAVQVLGQFAWHLPALGPLILKYAQDSDDRVSEYAAAALGSKIAPPEDTIPVLIIALESKYPGTRAAAAESLGRYGPEAIQAVPKLKANLLDADANVRRHIAEALSKIVPVATTNAPSQ